MPEHFNTKIDGSDTRAADAGSARTENPLPQLHMHEAGTTVCQKMPFGDWQKKEMWDLTRGAAG